MKNEDVFYVFMIKEIKTRYVYGKRAVQTRAVQTRAEKQKTERKSRHL